MGLMDFLKKKDDMPRDNLGFDTGSSPLDNNAFSSPMNQHNNAPMNYGNDFGSSNLNNMNGSMFGQNQQQSMPHGDIQKDLQLISLKLDSIKSELDAMNQRLKAIETIAEKEQQPKNKKWY